MLTCRTALFCYWFASSSSPSSSLLLDMQTEVSKSQLYKQKRPPPHCDALTSVFHPCSSESMAFQRFLLQKSKWGANSSPCFMDHPVKLARPLVPCSGLTASINKVPIHNNIVRQVKARISCHTQTSWRLLARLRTKVLQHCLSVSRHGVNTGYAAPGGAADGLPALLKTVWSYRLSALGRCTVPVYTNWATVNTSLFSLLVSLASS